MHRRLVLAASVVCCAFPVVSSTAAAPQIPAGHFVSAHVGTASGGSGGVFVTHPRNPGSATPITGLPFELVGPNGPSSTGANAIAAMPDGSLVVGMLANAVNAPAPMFLYHLDIVGSAAVVRRAVLIGMLAAGQRGQTAQIELASPNLVVFSGSLIDVAVPTGLGLPGGLNGSLLGTYDPRTGAVAPIAMTAPPGGLRGTLNALASDGATVWFAMLRTPGTFSDIYRVPIGGGAATLCATLNSTAHGMDLDSNGDILVLGSRPMVTIDPTTCALGTTCPGILGLSLAYDPVTNTLASALAAIAWSPLASCAGPTTLAMPPAAGWGQLAGIAVMPNPSTFGDPSPTGGPGFHWIVPPGVGGPVLGNPRFALECVDTTGAPAGATGAWILGLGPLAPPIAFCGAVLLTDPTTWIASGPFGPTGTLPLSIAPTSGLTGFTLWLQSVHLWGPCLASSDALSMTIL